MLETLKLISYEYNDAFMDLVKFDLNTEHVFKEVYLKMLKDKNYTDVKFIDAYKSLEFNYKGERAVLLNAYGEKDNWDEIDVIKDVNVLLVTKDKIYFHLIKDNLTTIKSNLEINLDAVGGKRGYYSFKDSVNNLRYVLIRYNKEEYNKLNVKHKNKDSENWLSGPHFRVNLY